MFNEHPEQYEAYKRASEAIARARTTEGANEAGLWCTAVVESAAAITEAIFELANSTGGALNDEQELFYRLGGLRDIAEAIEKLAPSA